MYECVYLFVCVCVCLCVCFIPYHVRIIFVFSCAEKQTLACRFFPRMKQLTIWSVDYFNLVRIIYVFLR